MSKFTATFEKARDVLRKQKFSEPDWDKFLTQTCSLLNLFGVAGFESAYAKVPVELNKKINAASKHGDLAAFFVGGGVGDVIFDAAQNPKSPGTWTERAATLKLVRHVYHAHKQGGQDVWVYSPPKGHKKPIFEELEDSWEKTAKVKLGMDEEIFSSSERDLMCDALGLARKIALDAKAKVDAKDDATKAMVKRWFLDEKAGDKELNYALSKLSEGILKIAAACGSSTLVFTDYLDWRKKRDDYFGGAFRGGEGGGFPVIYLEGAFTRLKGNSGKLWLCAETILHELSHHEVRTEDHRYDSSGLKPNSSTLPTSKAIENADSWGYFMLDLAGYLSNSDFNNTWR